MTRPCDSLVSDTGWLTLRDKLRWRTRSLVIIFGSEIRGQDIETLVDFGSGNRARSLSASATTPTRVVRPTWDFIPTASRLSPDVERRQLHEEWWTTFRPTPGLNSTPDDRTPRKTGKLKALYVVGANPIARYNIDPFVLSKSFVVVQDMFLTETARLRTWFCRPPTPTRSLELSPTPAAMCRC